MQVIWVTTLLLDYPWLFAHILLGCLRHIINCFILDHLDKSCFCWIERACCVLAGWIWEAFILWEGPRVKHYCWWVDSIIHGSSFSMAMLWKFFKWWILRKCTWSTSYLYSNTRLPFSLFSSFWATFKVGIWLISTWWFVMTEGSNWSLSTLIASCCSSQQSIWNILRMLWLLSDQSWLHNCLATLFWSNCFSRCMDFWNLISDWLLLETVLSCNNLSFIFDTENRSTLRLVLIWWWACTSIVSWLLLLVISIDIWSKVLLWFSTNVSLWLFLRLRSWLVVGYAACISLLCQHLMLLLWDLSIRLRWSSNLVKTYLLLLLRVFGSLFSESLLVSSIQSSLVIHLIHAIHLYHLCSIIITLWWLDLFRWRSLLSEFTLLALLGCWVSFIRRLGLLIGSLVNLDLLIDLNWSISHSKSASNTHGSVWLVSFLMLHASFIVEWAIINLQFNRTGWLICCRRWELGSDADWLHCFF